MATDCRLIIVSGHSRKVIEMQDATKRVLLKGGIAMSKSSIDSLLHGRRVISLQI